MSLLDGGLWLRRFPSLAAHQSIESREICTTPPLGKKRRRIHDRQFLCDGNGNELIYAHSICLGASLDFRSHRAWQPKLIGTL